jgi:hypothetical protein
MLIGQYTGYGPTGLSLAFFNDNLWIAFLGTDQGTNQSSPVLVCSSSDGIGWTNYVSVNQYSYAAPALTAAF